jgi:hypothetical protein
MKGSSWQALDDVDCEYDVPQGFPVEPKLGQLLSLAADEGAELVGLWRCYSAETHYWWPSGGRFTSNSRWIGDLLPGFAFHQQELALAGTETVAPLLQLAEAAGLWIAKERAAFLSERPHRFELDTSGRLHASDGPALAWRDGRAVYAWHGIRVPAHVIDAPETLSAREIVCEPNAEVRRVMLERVGYERFFAMQKMKLVSKDKIGKLWRLELRGDIEEPLMLVEVENATVEPDGTRKRYLLRVPPYMRTARDAVAWTFGFDRDEYQLIAAS